MCSDARPPDSSATPVATTTPDSVDQRRPTSTDTDCVIVVRNVMHPACGSIVSVADE